jgi:hypothetical protein
MFSNGPCGPKLPQRTSPVEVLSPGVRGFLAPDGEYLEGDRSGLYGLAAESQACLLRSLGPLLGVAGVAAGDDVLPDRLTAPCPRDDMIVGTVGQSDLGAAVLAPVLVPAVDVDTAELDRLLVTLEGVQEADHSWHLEDEVNRLDLLIVLLDNFDLTQEE